MATGGRPRIVEEHDGATSLIAAVEAGGGVALVSQSLACTAGGRLKFLTLSPAPAPLVVGAGWVETTPTPAADLFLKCARAAAGARE